MPAGKGYYTKLALFAVLGFMIALTFWLNDAVTVYSEASPIENRKTLIIDAGHGGVDGGATSCTGVLESRINLQIALRLDDLCHLLGVQTKMIRTQDISVYTEGNTIAAKKVSDLNNRVRIINETDNAVLVSIHQNYFQQSQYSGAQVFYPETPGSKELAQQLQSALINTLNPGSTRKSKPSDHVYLMKKIQCTGVLVECGFLSNPAEEAKLRDATYQKKLCAVIATKCSEYMFDKTA